MVAALLVVLALPGAALAAKPGTGYATAVTGMAEDGRTFDGIWTIEKFQKRGGEIFAVGKLTGTIFNEDGSIWKSVNNRNLAMPVTGLEVLPGAGGEGEMGIMQQACQILVLDLGPVDLNLLGLRVFLDEVHLLIEAIPGEGALLGNLLCALVGLLDPPALPGIPDLLNQIVGILNQILAIL
jgi:hypothetical protein